MADPNKKRPSIYAFIEQTARMLRSAAQLPLKKKRKYSKEDGLSTSNKIRQIALLLRSQVKKVTSRKKKSD